MYLPRETKLMRDARAAGSTDVMNGDTMLLHQTAAAFNLWTGRDVSLELLQERLDQVRECQRPPRLPRRCCGHRLTGRLSTLVDRAVNRTALPGRLTASPESHALVARARPIDLLVGSALFRDSFVGGGRGHVDLPRARSVGYGVVGLTVATSWPDVGGTLSRWHFRSLGLPPQRGSLADGHRQLGDRSHRALVRGVGRRAGRGSRSVADLERCLAVGGPIGVLLGVQGGHVLEGDLRNVARLSERGRAHVRAGARDGQRRRSARAPGGTPAG